MKHKSIFVLVLAVVLIFAMSAATFAATSTKASVPVTLSVSNEYRSVNVTVPASLPVEVVKKVDGQKVQEVRIVYNFVGEIPEIAA